MVSTRSRSHNLIVDLATGKQLLDVPGEERGGNGALVAIGDDLYDLDTAKRVAKPYACVDGVPDLATDGAAGLPHGPLHWSP